MNPSPVSREDSSVPSASTSLIISWSSASVGFWPSDLMTVPSSFVVMVPSPSLSNREKASLNSEQANEEKKKGHLHSSCKDANKIRSVFIASPYQQSALLLVGQPKKQNKTKTPKEWINMLCYYQDWLRKKKEIQYNRFGSTN